MTKTCRFGLVVLAVFVSAALQTGVAKEKKDQEQQAAEKAENAARLYDRLKEFSTDLYEKNNDFREQVEKHYDHVQQQHSQEAFENNIAPPARPTVVHDGDRLRLQTGLYDNKIVQDYINRVGQQLVPSDAHQLFAFRLVAHPLPFANTLSTGTIYISTGLISMLDNEAQLAYVLGHEMAHVYKDHWKLKSVLELGEEEFNKKQERKRKLIGLGIGLGAAAVTGGITKSGENALVAGTVGGIAGYALSHLFLRGINLEWDPVQENEADKIAFREALAHNYDVQVVPTLYVAMDIAVQHDQRVGLGFIGSRKRLKERIKAVNELIAGEYKQQIGDKLKEGKLVGSGPDFNMVMSELKRDNGILAFYHDMFDLARNNLEYAVNIRSNDPGAHYYFAKVLKIVGRTDGDKQRADQEFTKAIQTDKRSRYYGAHLYRALFLMNLKDETQKPQVVESLQSYLNAYLGYTSEEAVISSYLPANLDDLYDYMAQSGETIWTPKIPEGTARRISAFSNEVGATLPARLESGFPASLTDPRHQPDSPGTATHIQNVAAGAAAGAALGSAAGTKGAAVGGAAGAVTETRKTTLKKNK